jgi:hypothetical protein
VKIECTPKEAATFVEEIQKSLLCNDLHSMVCFLYEKAKNGDEASLQILQEMLEHQK